MDLTDALTFFQLRMTEKVSCVRQCERENATGVKEIETISSMRSILDIVLGLRDIM